MGGSFILPFYNWARCGVYASLYPNIVRTKDGHQRHADILSVIVIAVWLHSERRVNYVFFALILAYFGAPFGIIKAFVDNMTI